VAGRERGIQADAGVGHAEAVRPDQPHAVAAADPQQLRAAGAVQPRADHDQRLDASQPALLGDTGHGLRRHGDDGQIDGAGQRGR
jgi:hypothetical protein